MKARYAHDNLGEHQKHATECAAGERVRTAGLHLHRVLGNTDSLTVSSGCWGVGEEGAGRRDRWRDKVTSGGDGCMFTMSIAVMVLEVDARQNSSNCTL